MIHSSRQMEMGKYFQSRGSNTWNEVDDEHNGGPPENPLLLFCDLILKYEKYKQTEDMVQDYSSSGSEKTSDSFPSDADLSFNNNNYSNEDMNMIVDNDPESWDLITCFCMKPFKGRPMIECNSCGTWLHMSCAKVKANNVPDIFLCQTCQDASSRKRRSGRIRSDDRRYSP